MNRLYVLLPNKIIEGNPIEPISESNLFIRLNRGNIEIYYTKQIIHTDLSDVIIFCDVNIDCHELEFDENKIICGLDEMIQSHFGDVYQLTHEFNRLIE